MRPLHTRNLLVDVMEVRAFSLCDTNGMFTIWVKGNNSLAAPPYQTGVCSQSSGNVLAITRSLYGSDTCVFDRIKAISKDHGEIFMLAMRS